MKIAIYTCITGGYDDIKPPLVTTKGVDYLCFTDQASRITNGWQFKEIPKNLNLNNKDLNRFLKMHPHIILSEYDLTIYIDGSIQIVGGLTELINEIIKSKELIFLYDHPFRSCIYKESVANIHYAHDIIFRIVKQMRKYHQIGFPENFGLFECGIIFCKRSASVSALMENWWEEYCLHSKRDQLSFTYCVWRNNITIGRLGKSDHRFTHKYFKFINHYKKISIKSNLIKYINRSIAKIVSYNRLFGLNNVSLIDVISKKK
jgi:hypothetical protein